ncbi:unnamed protein product [Brassica napus]|uniref:(rape) hypothetical protein n=1 Tax=Brassica napus TaxID=3708 RepID=A0A816ZIJ5_BRANA|nr:unnamed protein product [Brassica napus]
MRIMVINVERHLMKKLFMITVPTNSIQAAKTHSPDSPVQRLRVLYSHSVWFVSLFGFGLSNRNNPSVFGATGSSIVKKSEGSGFPSKQEVPQRQEKRTRKLPSQLSRFCLNISMEDGESVVQQSMKKFSA